MSEHEAHLELPGAHLDLDRMPGHWLLARMGKRVLRPGGLELTTQLLERLEIGSADHVVELAPGLGATTRLILARDPAAYLAVERDAAAVRATQRLLRPGDRIRHGSAADTGLASASATVVFGEALLTMQTEAQKAAIVREAERVLRPGGRYAIHELALAPDDLPDEDKQRIQRELCDVIHVGARPLTVSEWKRVLEGAGFEPSFSAIRPMHLLEPARFVADEGWLAALRFTANFLRTPAARRRVLAMRSVFRKYAPNLCALAVIARKQGGA